MLHLLKGLGKSGYFLITLLSICLIVMLLYAFPPLWKTDSKEDPVVKITFADDITPAYRKVIAIFNEENRGRIRIETINIPFSKFSTNERKELFSRFFRTKSSQVDVFSVDEIWTAKFAKWGDPLDDKLTPEFKSSILPSAIGTCYYDSTLVALPLFIDVSVMYYRKDVIDRLPDAMRIEDELSQSISWEDFIRLAGRFSEGDNPFYVFQADNYEGLMCSFAELMAGLNAPLYSDGVFNLQSTPAERAAKLMVDLVHKYHMSPEVVAQLRENSSFEYSLSHGALFLRGWPNFERSLQDSVTKNVAGERWAMAPLPHFSGLPRASMLGGWNLMISRQSLHKEEAMTFVNFLLSKRVQEMMYEEGGYLPTNTLVYQDSSCMSKNPDLTFYLGLLKTGVHRPSLADYTRFSDIISYYLNLAIKQKISPATVLSEANKAINSEADY